jgi:hypothetical protein
LLPPATDADGCDTLISGKKIAGARESHLDDFDVGNATVKNVPDTAATTWQSACRRGH